MASGNTKNQVSTWINHLAQIEGSANPRCHVLTMSCLKWYATNNWQMSITSISLFARDKTGAT
jgi:hypothetical protein